MERYDLVTKDGEVNMMIDNVEGSYIFYEDHVKEIELYKRTVEHDTKEIKLLTAEIDQKDEEIERLRKEKEWLIERASFDVYSFMYPTKKEKRQYIIDQMQQALKEG